MYKVKLNVFLELVFILLVFFITLILGIDKIETGKLLIVIVFLSNLQQLIKYRFFDIVFLFLFFGILYWVYLLAYYFFNIPYHIYFEYQTPYLTNMVVLLQFLFQRFILIGIEKTNYKRPVENLIIRQNHLIYYTLIFILVVMAILCVYGQETILTQSYSIDSHSSILFEYCIPVLIVAFMYADTKYKKYILFLFGIVFMVEPLLFGRRLPFLMVAFTLFNLYFSGRVKMRFILLAAILSFILLRYLGDIRNPIDGQAGILFSILSLSSKGVMQNNQGGVVVCAVTYLGLIKEGVFDVFFRLKSFIGLFSGVLIPSSLNLSEAYINFEALKHSNIPGNGGFPSTYLYLWGGYLGVFFGACWFNKLIRNKQNSRVVSIYVLFLLSVFPRWYAYNMMILVKMGFWLIFLVAITDTFHIYTKKRCKIL